MRCRSRDSSAVSRDPPGGSIGVEATLGDAVGAGGHAGHRPREVPGHGPQHDSDQGKDHAAAGGERVAEPFDRSVEAIEGKGGEATAPEGRWPSRTR